MADTNTKKPQLAWIGLGNMGRGLSANLATKQHPSSGLPIILFNRTFTRTQSHAASLPTSSTIVANTIQDAVSPADLIFTSLGKDDSVLSIYTSILAQCSSISGKCFIETSTILPETTEKICTMVEAAGAQFVAAPVFGAPAHADAGTVIAVLAGKREAVERVRPYCDGIFSRATIDLTDRPVGTASLLKLTGNTFILSMVLALSEGHTFAEKSGLGTDVLHQFISLMFPGPYTAYSERMLSGDYYTREEPLFAVGLARKDAGHAMRLAKEAGVELEVVKRVDKELEWVQRERGEGADMPGMFGAVRARSGLNFGNQGEEKSKGEEKA